MNFLTARWENLLLANYSIDPVVLKKHIPAKTQIDTFEGHVFVSLVAFMFRKTRVLRVPIPFHRNFEEVNLRFYVTPDYDRSKRSVVFIKEIVPRRAIPLIANTFFDENYAALPMSHKSEAGQHSYSWGKNLENAFAGKVESDLSLPVVGSIGEFITEHYWGYSNGSDPTIEYEVKHPQWECCDLEDYQIEVDFEANYGKEFAFLQGVKPFSVQYARGSEVSVSFPRRI